MHKVFFCKTFWILFTILILMGGQLEGQTTPQYGGILRIIEVAEGSQPIGTPWQVKGSDVRILTPFLDTLLREDIRGNYHPWLATDYKIDTTKHTLTLTLRKGVKFHDGTDLNAEAVAWCINNAIAAGQTSGFKKAEPVDTYTVRIQAEVYKNTMLYELSRYTLAPVSPTAYNTRGKDWAMWNPVGTGPFKFVKFERGNKLAFQKWEGYWMKGRPYLDGIEYLFIRDPMTQQAAMLTGEPEKAHYLVVNAGEIAASLKQKGMKIPLLHVGPVCLIPDSKNPDSPLAKRKVREAISYAINREAIAQARGFGFYVPGNQIPQPGDSGYVENKEFGRYDPKKARQLLAEAGYPNGFSMKLITMPATVDRETMVAIQRYLAEVGITAELEFPDGGKYTAYRWRDGWKNGCMVQALRMFATANISYLYNFQVASGQWPSLKRPDGFLEKLEESLKTVKPDPKRMAELTKMLMDDVTVIPTIRFYEMHILQPNVQDSGIGEHILTLFKPEEVWFSK